MMALMLSPPWRSSVSSVSVGSSSSLMLLNSAISLIWSRIGGSWSHGSLRIVVWFVCRSVAIDFCGLCCIVLVWLIRI